MIQNMIINKKKNARKLKIIDELDDTLEIMRNIKFIAAKIKKLKCNLGFTLDRLVIMKK